MQADDTQPTASESSATGHASSSRIAASKSGDFFDDYGLAVEARTNWARARSRFFRHRLAAASLIVLILVFAAGLLAGHLAPFGYFQINVHALSTGPSWHHPFGTDGLGRDYFSRVLYGLGTEARVALLVGFFGTLIGTLVGVVSGYFGGVAETVLMRATDLMLTMPPLIVLLVAAAYLHATTVFKISVLFACVLWMPIARIVRGTCLSLREKEYVEAARALGASDLRIIGRHIVPNAFGPIAVAATLMTAGAVILETTLAYLGFGFTPSQSANLGTVSLGDVMSQAKDEGLFNWWGIVFPGLAIVLIVMPIHFVGDGIRDALDPTERRYARPRRPRRKHAPRAWSRLLAAIRPPRRLPGFDRDSLAERLGLSALRFDPLRPMRPILAPIGGTLTTIADALANRSQRRAARRGIRRLLLEAGTALALTAAVAAVIYVWKVNPTTSPWPATGTAVQNVSRAVGAQTELSVAVAPSHSNVLFAASNDTLLRTIRVYTSVDGGRTWSSSVGPSLGPVACARGEPSVTIGPGGREYVAFIVNGFCTENEQNPYLVVAARAGPGGRWTVSRIARARFKDSWDAKPALAAGLDGRVYVVWSRLLRWTYETTVVSSSADGGRRWSQPRMVDRRLASPQLVSAATDTRGALYVAGVDARLGIWVAKSNDTGAHFRLRRVARLPWNRASSCSTAANHPTPFQATRCLGPNPTVAATGDRVYVTYGVGWVGQPQSVAIGVLDRALRPIGRGRIGPFKKGADQFWPTSAIDPHTGQLWACYYDTSGDPSRKKAWFSCTSSRDGRHWTTPVRAARASASPDVLWEDARFYQVGDVTGYGGYTSLALGDGVAHPMWIDTRDIKGRVQEIFSARLAETTLR